MRTRRCILSLALLAGISLFTACSSDDDVVQINILENATGIVPLTSGVGDWDAAFLTRSGYFCYSGDALATDTEADDGGKFVSVTYMAPDGSDIVSILATEDGKIPSQMVTSKGIAYFSFPNDTILELLYDDGETVAMLDSIPYDKTALPSFGKFASDAFKGTLANIAKLLKGHTQSGIVAGGMSSAILSDTYGTIFEEVCDEDYVQDDELVAEVPTNNDGNYSFTETMGDWYEQEVSDNVCNTLLIWTGNASFKVGGSSCTLSGTIWCPSNTYNEYGTYGILCDTEVSNLVLDAAEYEGTGYQSENDLSFGVDFRGFKPNTTYYYRAYYQFNSADHGNIVPKHGSPSDQVIYDTVIKSFQTGDNSLTVDVVMCIDVTGSMSGIINTVKTNAIGFYDAFNTCCENEGIQLVALNTQVIAYRDMNVDSDWLNVSETYSLPSQRTEFNSFVNALYANGGGDTPESGLEVLETAFGKSDWGADDGYHRQVVILWTDAPYLVNTSTSTYSTVVLDELEAMWNSLPSGRRLILFAPYGTAGCSNGGDWGNLDGWTNLIHETDLSNGFNNFDYILEAIIGELTGKAKVQTVRPRVEETFFRPNE